MEHRVNLHESSDYGSFSEFVLIPEEPKVAVLAPHGGQVEPNTDIEAEMLGEYLDNSAIVWGTRGITDDDYGAAFDRWHTSGDKDPLSIFALYQQVVDEPVEYAISFHVMSEEGIIVGGRAEKEVRKDLMDELEKRFPGQDVRLGEEGEPRAGMNPKNFVNNFNTENPIQIEQSKEIVFNHPTKLVEALNDWLSDKL